MLSTCKYKISLSIGYGALNWLDAVRGGSAHGRNWRDYLKSESSREVFDKAKSASDKEALVIIKEHLRQKYDSYGHRLDEYMDFINNEFLSKFDRACKVIEDITNRELYVNNYIVYITTFPRSPYDSREGYFYVVIGRQDPIATFLYEVLHFQFENY